MSDGRFCASCRYRAAAAPQPPPDPATRPPRAPRQLSETERAARLLFPDEFSSDDEADGADDATTHNAPAPQQARSVPNRSTPCTVGHYEYDLSIDWR